MIDITKIDSLVATELARLCALTAADLIDGAPRRALSHGPLLWSPPDSNGNIGRVEITLVPDTYHVATQLGLYVWLTVDPSGVSVILRASPSSNAHAVMWPRAPDRADLVAATRLALDGESRAVEVASKALDDTGARPPSGTWAQSLLGIMLDPRLPVPDFHVDSIPSWILMFEPIDHQTGTCRGVILTLPDFVVVRIS